MSESNREQILEAFKTFLTNVTTANGFNNNVTGVYRKRVTYDDPKIGLPVLMVLGSTEMFSDQLGEYTVSDPFRIKICGMTKDEFDPETTLNSLIKDALSILDNPLYNTYHKAYKPISLDTDEGWLAIEMNGIGMFELTIELRYRFLRSDP